MTLATVKHMRTTLEPFEHSHLPLLREWLARPHVAAWYPRPDVDVARAADGELRADASVSMLGLTSSIDNVRAHRAFAKAGFQISRQYDPGVVGPCYLLLRDLRSERVAMNTAVRT